MKKKLFGKHLCLNKETIAHLDPQEMENVKGGCTTETLEYTCGGFITESPSSPPKPSENTCDTQTTPDT